ncbi:MAG: hypothetical protein WD152_03470 [Nitriliruptoraceae bacterium]
MADRANSGRDAALQLLGMADVTMAKAVDLLQPVDSAEVEALRWRLLSILTTLDS